MRMSRPSLPPLPLRTLVVTAAALLACLPNTTFAEATAPPVEDAAEVAPPPAPTPAAAPDASATASPEAAAAAAEDPTQLTKLSDATMTHTIMWGGRIVGVPDGMIDPWFEKHGSHWEGQSNFSFGLDYTLRFVDVLDLNIGVYYTDLSMVPQYWLEVDSKVDSADYIKQTLQTVSLEVNVFGIYDFLPNQMLGIFYGGGLWGGAVFGEVAKANVDPECAQGVADGIGSLEYCPYDRTFIPQDGLPPVLGFVNVAAGVRSVLSERFVLRAEAGFRGYFYGGLAMGFQVF